MIQGRFRHYIIQIIKKNTFFFFFFLLAVNGTAHPRNTMIHCVTDVEITLNRNSRTVYVIEYFPSLRFVIIARDACL